MAPYRPTIEGFFLTRVSSVRHAFTPRLSATDKEAAQAEAHQLLASEGWPMEWAVYAGQPHGNRVAVVRTREPKLFEDADALVTNVPGIPLVVRVADCGAVYFFDPIQRAIGMAHSGKKGTAANIVHATIGAMVEEFHTDPANLIVQLGPCIRPPHYEVDFAAEIVRQVKAAGVTRFQDCGVCTASHLEKYYSYRAEKGQTGRMLAVMMLE